MKLFSLFAGIGAPEAALEKLGIEYELVGFSEIDKFAPKSYCAIHDVPMDKNYGDITKIDEKELPKDIDLITYGFPCVPAGSLIKTDEGYKPIEDVKVGDMVLTHNNRYRKVLKTMHRDSDHLNCIKAAGVAELLITDEHPVYVYRNEEFLWVKVKDLDPRTDKVVRNIDERGITYEASQSIVGDKICSRIKEISRFDTNIHVYNIEVEEDNSYTVNGTIVHNCQDISNAGKQKGLFNEDGTKTRSGLFFDALRTIEETQPKVAIAENVKALTQKKFKEQFELVLASLEEAGYVNYWKVLNATEFGVPQNRERVFIVSIRKDLDNGSFKFPEGFELEKRLKDVLERNVPDSFYLSDVAIEGFEKHRERHDEKGNGFG